MKSKCSSLPTQTVTDTFKGSDFSLINGTLFYALVGSSVALRICGKTNRTTLSERLEVILVDRLEALLSLQEVIDKYHMYRFEYFYSGTGGNQECKDITFDIIKNGYHAMIFLAQPLATIYTYTASITRHFINSSQLPFVEWNTLRHDKDSHKFSTDSSKSCFVATIKKIPGISKSYVHIRLTYEYAPLEPMIVSLVVVLVCCLLAMIIFFVTVHRTCIYARRSNVYEVSDAQ